MLIFIVGAVHTALHCGPWPTSFSVRRNRVSFSLRRGKGTVEGTQKAEKGERQGGEKTSEKSKTTESSRLPVDSCLSSPLLPPLLRSSTKLRDLVHSFPPTEAQLPYHVTAAPTNQSRSESATMMDSTARMQHVSGATRTTAAGAPTSFSLQASRRYAHRSMYPLLFESQSFLILF